MYLAAAITPASADLWGNDRKKTHVGQSRNFVNLDVQHFDLLWSFQYHFFYLSRPVPTNLDQKTRGWAVGFPHTLNIAQMTLGFLSLNDAEFFLPPQFLCTTVTQLAYEFRGYSYVFLWLVFFFLGTTFFTDNGFPCSWQLHLYQIITNTECSLYRTDSRHPMTHPVPRHKVMWVRM